MKIKANTGGLKEFIYDKNSPTYSSQEEEKKYDDIGNKIYEAQKKSKFKRRFKKIGIIILILIIIAFVIGYLI